MSRRSFLLVGMAILSGAMLMANLGNAQPDREQDTIEIDGHTLPAPRVGELPIGTVIAIAAPQDTGQANAIDEWLLLQGWMRCDGRPLKQSEFPYIFFIIGTAHGAGYANDGSGTHVDGMQFNLPDYRGRFLRGVSGFSGRDPDADDRPRMNNEGNEGNLVGTVQNSATALPRNAFGTTSTDPHRHTGTTDEDGEHRHEIPFDSGDFDDDAPHALARIDHRISDLDSVHRTARDGAHTHTFETDNEPGHSHTVSTGGDHETRPANANVNWIIKVR